jgi:hypothetical protein
MRIFPAFYFLWRSPQKNSVVKTQYLASDATNWRWPGPEVKRIYPPDREIVLIPPDTKGFRDVPLTVQLTWP